MAKIKKPEADTANGNNGDDVIYGKDESKVESPPAPEAAGKDESWLDELTQSQDERDQQVKEQEQNPAQVRAEYRDAPADYRQRSEEVRYAPRQNPIPARQLGDYLVDAAFQFIKDGGHPPNWPRMMTAIGFLQQQLRRRWHELTGARSRYGKKYEDRESARERRPYNPENFVPPAEPRGGEVHYPQNQPEQPASSVSGHQLNTPQPVSSQQMGEPAPGVEVPTGGRV